MTTTQERKQQERRVRRRRIQAAARGVFAEKGYAKTSIEQIARQANLSVGAIYLYFRSKEDLYVSLLEDTLDHVSADLCGLRTADRLPAGRLHAAWSHLVEWASRDVEATRVLRFVCQPGVRAQLSDEVAAGAAARLTFVRDQLALIVKDGASAGAYRPTDATAAASLLFTLFLGLLQQENARENLGLPGPALAEAADAAFGAYEATLKGAARTLQAA
jgi:AcrR family transcriptional regulator